MSESKNKIEIVVKMPVGTTGGFFQFEPVRDEQGLVNLTDLWRRFGAIPNREPKQWRRFEGREFVAALAYQEKVSDAHLFRATRGRNGATFGHWQIAMSYLTYLSPEAQMLVNQIVRERLEEEADPELGVRRAVERHTRRLKALGRSDDGRTRGCGGNSWFIPYETKQDRADHPATFPVAVPERCLRLAGARPGQTVLDPFGGIGNTALACARLGVSSVSVDIDPSYTQIAHRRVANAPFDDEDRWAKSVRSGDGYWASSVDGDPDPAQLGLD